MFTLLKVTGDSMSPKLIHGDFVLISRWLFLVKENNLVIIEHPIYNLIIKRIKEVREDGSLWLSGDGESSISSERIGWVNKDWIVGTVIKTIKKKN